MKKTFLALTALGLFCAACYVIGSSKKQEKNEKSESSKPTEREPENGDGYALEESKAQESEIDGFDNVSETTQIAYSGFKD